MMLLQFAVVLIFIFIGARIGGLGIGLAGAAGVIVLGLMGVPVSLFGAKVDGTYANPEASIPWTVLGIILTVVTAIGTLQAAGGLDHLVHVTEKILRKNPKRISFLAPIVTYFMTLFCGTGYVALSAIPIIAQVSKETGVRPSRPLSISVVASQVAIAASPISAATIAMLKAVEPLGVSYFQLLMVTIPTTFIGCMVGALIASRQGKELEDDPVYQERVKEGLVSTREEDTTSEYKPKPGAIPALWIFAVTVALVIGYAIFINSVDSPALPRDAAIMTFMLASACVMGLVSKVNLGRVTGESTFRSGMSALVCIVGVAWLGNTFVQHNIDAIKDIAGNAVHSAPWLLAVVLFLASALLYSQGATTAALMPVAASLGVAPTTMVASYPAVTGLFILPTYPTTVAAIEMDDTGSTRIGKAVINHPFIIPGTVSVAVAVLLGFGLAPLVIG